LFSFHLLKRFKIFPPTPPSTQSQKRRYSGSQSTGDLKKMKVMIKDVRSRRTGRYLKSYRRSASKSRGLTAAQASSVAKIARSVVHSTAELKSYYTSWSSLQYDNLVSGFNPIYPISEGSTAETVIGEKMFLRNIQVSGFLYPNVASAGNTCMARLVILHSRDKLFVGSQSNIRSSTMFRANGSGFLPVDQLDRHKFRDLHDQ